MFYHGFIMFYHVLSCFIMFHMPQEETFWSQAERRRKEEEAERQRQRLVGWPSGRFVPKY